MGVRRENKRRTIITDLGLGKTTSKTGYNAYMKEYMARQRALQKTNLKQHRELQQRINSPAKILFQHSRRKVRSR